MKRIILAAAALAVAVIGFGGLSASTTHASPAKLWLINADVAGAMELGATPALSDCDTVTAGTQFPCNLANPVELKAFLDAGLSLDDAATASAGQVGNASFTGDVYLVVQTNGSVTDVTLNPKNLAVADTVGTDGLVRCSGLVGGADLDCNGGTPTANDGYVVFTITGPGTNSVGSTVSLDVVQDSVSLSQDATVVGTPHNFDFAAVASKTTIQEAAASCELTDSITAPTRAGLVAMVTDIDGTSLVGVPFIVTFSSSATGTAKVSSAAGTGTTMLLPDGKTIAQYDVACGVAPGSATISAKIPAAFIGAAATGNVTRTIDFTVTGVPASIALTASPATIACDGTATSSVTAKVTDSEGNNVVDNTNVNFSVVALGTANPINVKTKDGEASSTITPLSGATAGVTVIVTSGDAQASIRVDCSLPVPTVPAASPTPTGGTGTIVGPNTGTGGYLGQDSSAGFPMWTLVALVLGSLVLVGGGMVTRRAGK